MNNNLNNRIMIFIDGSNFYYSTSKKGKRINFEKLISELSGNKKLIDEIKEENKSSVLSENHTEH